MGRREALAVAFLHGPAELLPVSSSGHVAAARALWGWDAGDSVALHAGSVAALLVARRVPRPRSVAVHLPALGIPAAIGLAVERHASSGDASERTVALGMLFGAALLSVADRASGARPARDAGVVDGICFGVAQAAALWPGVSRNGATLAAARLRGFARDEANLLSREVGLPVTLAAVALRRPRLGSGAVAAFLGALAALPLLGMVDRGGPLWPWAAERAGLALVLLRESRRDV